MWTYADSRSGMRDAMRLSRAMTYKAAVAGLAHGGGKGVIMLPDGAPPLTPRRRKAALLDFGDTVERLDGRYITAEDVGISSRDMTVIAQRTKHLTGLSRKRGGSGDPSPYTAMGVQAAIEVACERVFGSTDLNGRTIAVLGLGHVGGRLAQRCARAGAELVLSDIDGDKRALADKLGARWIDPAHALYADVDVVAPCALGAILDHESIPARRTTSSRRMPSATSCAPTGSSGRRTSSPTPAASSTWPPSSSPAATPRPRHARRCAASPTRCARSSPRPSGRARRRLPRRCCWRGGGSARR